MEPDRQIEIQLGHMCNNRCVFCVSGQRTALGQAGPVPVGPIVARIEEARAAGHRKITLLGGEPTLQPGFMEIVQRTVDLGFEEIVLFTNGAKTARPELVDALRATGGHFTWRISIQGATQESHERTTKKPGSFGRILRTLENLSARGERSTVNMCVVTSNYEDIDAFADLLLPFGVRQLHLDMVRPLDAGDRTEDELRAMVPQYSRLAEPLRRMVGRFPGDFDVNVGNLPYCVAPDLARWIHHDGEPTETIAIDGDDRLSRPWNKYLVKRRDKLKPASCASCVLDARCSGVFETYARFYGLDELVPIDADALERADPAGAMIGIWGAARLGALPGVSATPRGDDILELRAGELALELRAGSSSSRGAPGPVVGAYGGWTVHHLGGRADEATVLRLKQALEERHPVRHPLGSDLSHPLAPSLAAALHRLRAAAPFGALVWSELTVEASGERMELRLEDRDGGASAQLWLERRGERPSGGYRVEGTPSAALVQGIGAALEVLGSAGRGTARRTTAQAG